jgi:cardiolipin synthase
VQIVASGPDEREEAIHKSFLAAINQSERSVFLTTPYFIPERSLNLALQLAALRGVDVRILLPRTSDHKFVSMAGRSYYADLLKNGVKIFEYQRGVLHAKMLVVDGHFVSIGSANSDIRSFSYNFEVNVQIYGRAFARKAERIFLKDLESCKEIDLKKFLQRPAIKIFLENCCRLFSPVL